MTNPDSSRHWQQLAQKMVWSYSDDASEEMKRKVIARYRAGIHRRNVGIAAGLILLCGALILPLSAFFKNDVPRSVKSAPDSSTAADVQSRLQIAIRGEHTVDAASAVAAEMVPLATPLTPGTRFSVEEGTSMSTYRITEGSVRFETGPAVTRKLIVHVGALTIEDIGTVFTVETLLYDQVHVAVTEGRVKVTWPTGNAELTKGTDGTFPSGPASVDLTSTAHRENAAQNAREVLDWRTAARNGQNRLALQLIDDDPSRVHNQVADLLLAADVMRLTGNPQRAVPYLNRVVRQFPEDSRRPAAAFTLGKVLLNELDRPGVAAGMFALAAQKSSPLAEEAIAREAEAWYRAGSFAKSRMAARKYLAQYPNGARAESVRAFYNDTP